MEDGRRTFRILTDKPSRKIALGKPSVDGWTILELDLKEIGINLRNWVDLA